MVVYVSIPLHNDAFACVGGLLRHHYNRPSRKAEVLILQCHSEGVIWKGLAPLFGLGPRRILSWSSEDKSKSGCTSENSSKRRRRRDPRLAIAKRAASMLLDHFDNNDSKRQKTLSLPKTQGYNCEYEKDCASSNYCNCEDVEEICEYMDASGLWSIANLQIRQLEKMLILMPPNPNIPILRYYSLQPSTSPTSDISLRLIHLENTMIKLTTVTAYVSTLGGGYFLCNYLSTAVSLARQQCLLALIRGDLHMSLKCRLNEGYCYIHAGRIKRARRTIRRVLKDVLDLIAKDGLEGEDGLHHTPNRELNELTVIKNMAFSALRFAAHVRRELEHDSHALNGKSLVESMRSKTAII
ncbi:hypothetical protein THAOC_37090 [Thalassiosira oceanica]|uniref:Uncharacterized protein n=1 Tax=Thalassiosira oceanica TaxID=159749 RepID=K0QYR9_THAOC|nr:hypothetical protein THAOC_37090 [Thalassiosira oceanica]|eukprot:EJK44373.1 hypothetical protein THAOC_37090 [Thalassiosira oceanica]